MLAYRFHIVIISFLLGVALATLFFVSLPTIVWLCLVAFGLMVVATRWSEAPSATHIITISIATIICALGMLRFEVTSWQFGHSVFSSYVGQEVAFSGEVIKEPDVREQTTQLYIKTEDTIVLVSTDKYANIAYGDIVAVKGTIKVPEVFDTELGRSFNYPAYLLVRQVEYQISFADIEILSEDNGNPIVTHLLNIKQLLMGSIETVLTEPQAGLGEGLLLGVKQALGEDLEAAFRTSGIIHIVVLSGHNVMLIVSFILTLLSFLLPKRPRIIVALLAIAGFALLVGLSATVVRASIMASLLLTAQFFGRTNNLMRTLLFAGSLMVFINPYLLIYDIGFQFSFMATLGLVLIAPRFESFISDGFTKFGAREYLIATIATQIAVLPLLLYHIGEVSLVAIIVNVLVLPLVPFSMLVTFMAGAIGLFSTSLALPFSLLAHLGLSYIIDMATFFSSLPLASVKVPPFSPIWILVMYTSIGFGLWRWSTDSMRSVSRVDDWIIEEEEEKKLDAKNAPTTDTLPLFFR